MAEKTSPFQGLIEAVNGVILGKEHVVLHALTAVLAGGHILLEDIPGVGKTTLAHALAQGLGCTFRRIQFTSDLLPSDILGVNIYAQRRERFEFKPGPIFANVVLADEINRTTPKTQSSLLEAMNEGQVSVDDKTRPLPEPFIVIATQNPQDFQGTYPLPESQLDRFMVRLQLGYPTPEVERDILRHRRATRPVQIAAHSTAEEVRELQAQVGGVTVSDAVLDYILAIVNETRRTPQLSLGVSTRGALALQRATQARALLLGRDYVLPDDVKALALPVLGHRIQLGGLGGHCTPSHTEASALISRLLGLVPVPI